MPELRGQWKVDFAKEFADEFKSFSDAVQDELLTQARWIAELGPLAGRPRIDTLKGSRYPNMKELRFEAGDGVWRAAFAFDPKRKAIVLVAADKSGIPEQRFYRQLIAFADDRYARHLAILDTKQIGTKRHDKS